MTVHRLDSSGVRVADLSRFAATVALYRELLALSRRQRGRAT